MQGEDDQQKIAVFQRALGLTIRTARLEAGLGVERLARASGVHRTHIASLEKGQLNIRVGTLLKLADALQLQPDELIRRSVQRQKRSSEDASGPE